MSRYPTLILLALCVVFCSPRAEAGYNQSSYYSQTTYYSQSSYGATIQSSFSAGKDFTVAGHVSKGSGTFVIDHPLDPKNKLLYHSFVESPDAKDWYDGIVTLDARGEAVVTLPRYFEALNKDFRYQVKPVSAAMPDLHVIQHISNNQFSIGGGVAGGRVSWQVTGTRKDPYIEANPIIVEVPKASGELVDRGELLHESAYPSRLPSIRPLIERIGSLLSW